MKEKLYLCPGCGKKKPATHFTCGAGAKGGSAKGPRKARTSEQARAAAMARWGINK